MDWWYPAKKYPYWPVAGFYNAKMSPGNYLSASRGLKFFGSSGIFPNAGPLCTGHPVFFTVKQAACNVFFLVNKIMELRQKFVSQPFTKYNTTLFFEFGGKMWWNTDLLLIKKDLFEPNWMQPVSCWFSNLVMLRVGQLTMPIFGRIRQVSSARPLVCSRPPLQVCTH